MAVQALKRVHHVRPEVTEADLKAEGLPTSLVVMIVVTVFSIMVFLQHGHSNVENDPVELEPVTVAWATEPRAGPATNASWILLWTIRTMQFFVMILFLLVLFLVTRQRSILYMPTADGAKRSPNDNMAGFRSPSDWRLPYENLTIRTEDGTHINAWLIFQKTSPHAPTPYTLVYFHGNAGNMGHRLENLRDMHEHLGVNILIMDYRGYGDSENGSGPCQSGFMKDAMAAYRWLVDRIQHPPADNGQVLRPTMSTDKILLFGRSIGGAVAICFMAKLMRLKLSGANDALPLPAGLMVENTFVSLRNMAVTLFPALGLVQPLLRWPFIFDEWQASDDLKYISRHWPSCRYILLSGLEDKIVPPEQMRELHSVLLTENSQHVMFREFPRGGHEDTATRGGVAYWEGLREFLQRTRLAVSPQQHDGSGESDPFVQRR